MSERLEECHTGVLFLTQENKNAPWILFEAGALAKHLNESRVHPLLIGFDDVALEGPLQHINATLFTKEDVLKLVQSINRTDDKSVITEENLLRSFEVWWSQLETPVREILRNQSPPTPTPQRTLEDISEETLKIARSLSARFEDVLQARDEIGQSWEIVDDSIETPTERRRARKIHNLRELQELWPKVLVRFRNRIGVTAVAYIHDALPVEINEKEVILSFAKAFHFAKATEAAERLRFEGVLNECLASPRRLKFVLSEPARSNDPFADE